MITAYFAILLLIVFGALAATVFGAIRDRLRLRRNLRRRLLGLQP